MLGVRRLLHMSSSSPSSLSAAGRYARSMTIVDRCAVERDSTEALLSDERAAFLVHWRGRMLYRTDGRPSLHAVSKDVCDHAAGEPSTVFLGRQDAAPVFACDVSHLPKPTHTDGALQALLRDGVDKVSLVDSRIVMGALSAEDLALSCQARGLFAWHRHNSFCPGCGAPTVVSDGGHGRRCPECSTHHFPRTDPVVIALIVSECGQHVLLGRGPGWPAGVFSCLAGFVETGESAEEAVGREVKEEVGVDVHTPSYVSSQWWAPRSLMLGFTVHADMAAPITVDGVEMEAAQWFSKADIEAALKSSVPGRFGREDGGLMVPPKGAIAHDLMQAWCRGDTGAALSRL